MGYEMKLLVGIPHYYFESDEIRTINKVAEYDLSKPGGAVARVLDEAIKRTKDNPEAERFGFFAEDGDTIVSEDSYGDPVSKVDQWDLIRALHTELGGTDYTYGYRRYVGALALLETFVDPRYWPSSDVESIVVLTYGH